MLKQYSILKAAPLAAGVLLFGFIGCSTIAAEPSVQPLERRFADVVDPFLKNYCLACHGTKKREAKLDLSGYTSAAAVAKSQRLLDRVLERLEAEEMPPENAPRHPNAHERRAVLEWLRELREQESRQNAGDPGVVLARRLSNAEFDYTIRDLTGVDIRWRPRDWP